jgi:RimJ/RimL family protein N-acetyltransferase
MIRGRRVVLRPVDESDAPLIHRWMNHPEVWRFMDYERPVSLQDVVEDIQRSRAEGQPFIIEIDGRPVGRVGLNRFRRRDRACALYLYLGEPDAWGHGHAVDAVMALLGYAFDRLDLHQVELWTLGDNHGALVVYGRCGFVEEARLRDRSFKEGRWIEHVVMTVQRDEFATVRARWPAEPAGAR